jgi:hypothetical protein
MGLAAFSPRVASAQCIVCMPTGGDPAEEEALLSTLDTLGYTVRRTNTPSTSDCSVYVSHPGQGPVLGPPDLLPWVQSGNGVVQISDWGPNLISNSWQDVAQGSNQTVQVTDGTHPITSGLPASWVSRGFWAYNCPGGCYLGFATGGSGLASAGGNASSLAVSTSGLGRLVYIGWNVYGNLATSEDVAVLDRAVQWAGQCSSSTSIDCADWQSEVGTWGPGETQCGDLTSTANKVTYESASLATVYDDFTYEAEIVCTRPVQPSAANTLFVRGTPQPYQTAAQWWSSGIAFNISMTGKYSIFRYQGTKMIPLQSWTTPAGNLINPSGSPNTLTVVATGGTLTFSINGTPVKTINGQTILSGQVGLGMVRSVPTTQAGPNDTLVVSSATVTPGAPPQATRVSLQQEKANQAANRALPSPDPLFAPMSSSGIAGGR